MIRIRTTLQVCIVLVTNCQTGDFLLSLGGAVSIFPIKRVTGIFGLGNHETISFEVAGEVFPHDFSGRSVTDPACLELEAGLVHGRCSNGVNATGELRSGQVLRIRPCLLVIDRKTPTRVSCVINDESSGNFHITTGKRTTLVGSRPRAVWHIRELNSVRCLHISS